MRKLAIYFETENGRYSMTPADEFKKDNRVGEIINNSIKEISEKYSEAIIKSIIFFEDKEI